MWCPELRVKKTDILRLPHKALFSKYVGVIPTIETVQIRVLSITYRNTVLFYFLIISQIKAGQNDPASSIKLYQLHFMQRIQHHVVRGNVKLK